MNMPKNPWYASPPSWPNRGDPHHAGFTLLELLVAMTIFAVMAMMVHGGLASVLHTREVVSHHSDRLASLQMLFSLLQRDLEQAIPRPASLDGKSAPVALQGQNENPDFLEFTHSRQGVELTPLAKPLERVRYRLENNTLMRLTWKAPDPAPDATPTALILMEDVVQSQVRFLDAERNWSTQWKQTTLPLLVELNLVLKNGEQFVRLFRVTG